MLSLADERRTHFQSVFIRACCADKDSVISHCVHYIQSGATPTCSRCAFEAEVYRKEQTRVSNAADATGAHGKFVQPRSQAIAHGKRVLWYLIAL